MAGADNTGLDAIEFGLMGGFPDAHRWCTRHARVDGARGAAVPLVVVYFHCVYILSYEGHMIVVA